MSILNKQWHTLDEITESWSCSTTDIIHLALTNQLELCFNWRAFRDKWSALFVEFFFVEGDFSLRDPVYIGPGVADKINFVQHVGLWNFFNLDLDEAPLTNELYVPRDINPLSHLVSLHPEYLHHVADRKIKLPWSSDLTALKPVGTLSDFDFCIFTSKGVNIENEDYFSICIDELLITNAEKNRLETSVESQGKGSVQDDSSSYTTKWLTVVNLAMKELFNDTRQHDPKKEFAVEKISEIAKQVGVTPSERIASAIFTIIKPDDHDPKKRKG